MIYEVIFSFVFSPFEVMLLQQCPPGRQISRKHTLKKTGRYDVVPICKGFHVDEISENVSCPLIFSSIAFFYPLHILFISTLRICKKCCLGRRN